MQEIKLINELGITKKKVKKKRSTIKPSVAVSNLPASSSSGACFFTGSPVG